MLDLRKNLIERRQIELDRELANHYLGFNTYVTQRQIRPIHVKELSEKMKKGLFRFGEVAFAVRGDKKDILINGQHVCHAVVESDEIVPCMLERFRVYDDLELSEAFRQFEILPRSLTDMVKVEAHALNLSWPLWLSSRIVSAATMEIAEQKRLGSPAGKGSVTAKDKYMTQEDKVKLLGKYLEEGGFLSKILWEDDKNKISRFLQRKAVVYSMVQSWRADKNNANVFWSRVRDGENLTRQMPEMKLREFLIQTRTLNVPVAYRTRRVTEHEFAYRCAQAWNAFRSGRLTKLTYYPDKSIPKFK